MTEDSDGRAPTFAQSCTTIGTRGTLHVLCEPVDYNFWKVNMAQALSDMDGDDRFAGE